MSAVRGAIANVMAREGQGLDLETIDLDFAAEPALPVLVARPEVHLPMPAPEPHQPRLPIAILTLLLALVAGGGGAWFALSGGSPEPAVSAQAALAPARALVPIEPVKPTAPPTLPVDPLPPSDPLQLGRQSLAAGHVAEARRLFLIESDGASGSRATDIALLLARAFDDNYLRSLAGADAEGDKEQAKRWYRRWFDLATKDGTIPPTMRLDRLLASLD